jgi:hypothetical protein
LGWLVSPCQTASTVHVAYNSHTIDWVATTLKFRHGQSTQVVFYLRLASFVRPSKARDRVLHTLPAQSHHHRLDIFGTYQSHKGTPYYFCQRIGNYIVVTRKARRGQFHEKYLPAERQICGLRLDWKFLSSRELSRPNRLGKFCT